MKKWRDLTLAERAALPVGTRLRHVWHALGRDFRDLVLTEAGWILDGELPWRGVPRLDIGPDRSVIEPPPPPPPPTPETP